MNFHKNGGSFLGLPPKDFVVKTGGDKRPRRHVSTSPYATPKATPIGVFLGKYYHFE